MPSKKAKVRRDFHRGGPAVRTAYLRCPLMSLVISNIETWAFLKISLSFASALIMVLLALS